MSKEFNWGIIGCGHIAKTFAESFVASHGGKLLACAATDIERADGFAKVHKIPQVHASYNALVADANIDVVYIATTHNFHFEHIMMCLERGKHVLCEKPLTINANQARQVQTLAKAKNCLVIEAVWTRFLPAIQAAQKAVREGEIGEIKSMYANFSLNRILPDEHRLLNPALAGGALLDLGIYCITMADIIFEQSPIKAHAAAVMTHTGVDEVSNYMLEFEGGKTALLSSGFRQGAPCEAFIYGDRGHIRIPMFLGAKSFDICLDGEHPQTQHFDYEDEHKFSFEISHMNDCLAKGLHESPTLPLSKSLEIIQLMDDLRAQFGLRYEDD